MRQVRGKLALAGTAVGAAALLLAIPASAATTGSGTVQGSGTISPGLTTVPTAQSVSFTGTLVFAGTSGSGTYNCNFSGSSDIAETVAQGDGNVTGTCTNALIATSAISATVHYQRVAGDVVLTGTASGAASGSIAGDCSFEATSANPVKTYQLQCEVTIH